MAESMTFTLQGRDELSRVLNNAGANAQQMARRIEEANARASRSSGQTSVSLNGLTASLGNAGGAAVRFGSQAGTASSSMGAMGPAIAAAAGAAMTLLPAIGGLVPMMVGLGTAGIVGAVAFKGVKSAWDASAKSGKDYQKALSGMTESQKYLTGTLKDVRKEFKGYGDQLLGNVLPGITEGIREMTPAFGLFKAQGMLMGKTLGDLARDAGRALGSDGIRGDLSKNMTMGREFVDNFMRNFGKLGVSLLDFGAKSRKSFDSLNKGIGDIMGKGLPGFFKGLEPGIAGSAKAFDGLFSMVNKLLPSFGRLSGVLGETVGPALGSFFRFIGKIGSAIMDGLAPVLRELEPLFDNVGRQMDQMGDPIASLIRLIGKGLAGAVRIAVIPLKNIGDAAAAAWPILKSLGSTILSIVAPAFSKLNGKMGWTNSLRDFAKNNRNVIQAVMQAAANSVLDFITTVVNHIPTALHAFRALASGVATVMGGILKAAAASFSWVPGLGPKLAAASKQFDSMSGAALDGLGKAEGASKRFAAEWNKGLKPKQLKMNIDMFSERIKTVKAMLKDPDISKEKKIKLRAELKDLMADKAKAVKELDAFSKKKAEAKLTAKNNTGPGKKAAQGTILSLNGVTRGLYAKNNAGAGKRAAQGTILSLNGVTRGLYAKNGTAPGKRSAQGTMNSLSGVSRDLKASNKTRSGVSAAKAAIASVVGKTVSIYVNLKKALGFSAGGLVPGFATGGQFGIPGYATGGPKRFPTGGKVNGAGTSTSDSINAKLSNGEFVIRASSVKKYGAGLFAALNSGMVEQGLAPQHLASRGSASTQSVTNTHTTNVYPQRANFTTADLDLLQRKQEASSRIGRPR